MPELRRRTAQTQSAAVKGRNLYGILCLTAGITICQFTEAAENDYRHWSTRSGQRTKSPMKVCSQTDDTVILQREDGKRYRVKLSILSDEDLQVLKSFESKTKPPAQRLASKPAATETQNNWFRFRGPDGNGVASETIQLPLTWSENENVAWKTALPGAGASSPVTWDNHIYVTCFTGTWGDLDRSRSEQPLRLMLVCVDVHTGDIIWNQAIDDVEQFPEQHNKEGNSGLREHGHASSTPFVTADGIFVFYGASGLFRFDHDGKQIWRTSCGTNWHEWSYAASPIVHKDLVIVNAALECKHVLAFNKDTGKEVWRRDWISHSWGVPEIVQRNGRNIFLDAEHGQLLGLDADTGERLFSQNWMDGGSAMLVQGDIAYQVKTALRFSDSSAEVAWKQESGGRVPAPVLHDNRLYFCTEGKFQCRDASTGEFVFRARTPNYASCYASGTLNDDRIYFVTRRHGTFVLRASDKFELLAHNKLNSDDSQFNGSPAVVENRLILRSDKALYCLAKGN